MVRSVEHYFRPTGRPLLNAFFRQGYRRSRGWISGRSRASRLTSASLDTPIPFQLAGIHSVLPKRTMTVESPSGYKQFLTHKFTPLRIKSEHFCDSVSFQTTEYGAVERCPPLRSVMKSTFKALQLTEGKSGMSQVRGRNI